MGFSVFARRSSRGVGGAKQRTTIGKDIYMDIMWFRQGLRSSFRHALAKKKKTPEMDMTVGRLENGHNEE